MSEIHGVDRDKEIPWSSVWNGVLFLIFLFSGEKFYTTKGKDFLSLTICVVSVCFLIHSLVSKYRAGKRG